MKVFSVNLTAGTECSLSTNTIKSDITALLNMGKGQCISGNLNPIIKSSDPIANFLLSKLSMKFFTGEFIILTKTDKLTDGSDVTAKNMIRIIKDGLTCLTDKKTGVELHLQVLDLVVKKL